MTNMTFSYNDVFDSDTQQNRIKWGLFILPREKKDFHGLNYSEMAQIGGLKT